MTLYPNHPAYALRQTGERLKGPALRYAIAGTAGIGGQKGRRTLERLFNARKENPRIKIYHNAAARVEARDFMVRGAVLKVE